MDVKQESQKRVGMIRYPDGNNFDTKCSALITNDFFTIHQTTYTNHQSNEADCNSFTHHLTMQTLIQKYIRSYGAFVTWIGSIWGNRHLTYDANVITEI